MGRHSGSGDRWPDLEQSAQGSRCIVCGGEPDKIVKEQVTGFGFPVAVCGRCDAKTRTNSAYGQAKRAEREW